MSDRAVHYARNGDVRLAYRVLGDAGPHVVWVPGWMLNNVDSLDDPDGMYAEFVHTFAASTRLIVWDRRGTGLSDPAPHALSIDERIDDVRAILDAVGVQRADFVGAGEGGSMSAVFAAVHPDRVRSLALYGTAARYSQEPPAFPWGFSSADIAARWDEIDVHWGEGALADLFYGGATADSPGVRDMFGRLQRAMVSPTMAKLWWKTFVELDIRSVLPAVQAPTLVLARRQDPMVSFDAAAAMVAAIPDAHLHPLPQGPHAPFDILTEAVEITLEFICGSRAERADERALTTVMFTDIVRSTERLQMHGDSHWRRRLDEHDRVIDRWVTKFGGVRANHTGDGVFALFDAPSKAAQCALQLVPELASRDIPIRVGIHTGECERRGDQWSGMAVHTGARISALATPGQVLASRTVRDLSIGSGLAFTRVGSHQLRGLGDEMEIFHIT